MRISSQVRRFLFVLKAGAFQKILGAFLPTKKRLRKQKTDSEGNLSRFFCFWTRPKERLLFEIHAVSLAFGHKKAPLNCIKIEVQVWWRRRESNSCPKYIRFHDYLRDSHMIDNFGLFVWSCGKPFAADRWPRSPWFTSWCTWTSDGSGFILRRTYLAYLWTSHAYPRDGALFWSPSA